MLKRIYIDNFRSLVNFELTIDSINLFLGTNGSGKSSVFVALEKIQSFVSYGERTYPLFNHTYLTRWQNAPIQRFELEIEGNNGTYKYELAFKLDKEESIIDHERLFFNGKPLLIRDESTEAQPYLDDGLPDKVYLSPQNVSAIASMPEKPDNTHLIWFRERMKRFIIVQINPINIPASSQRETTRLTTNMSNFVSWYRYISQNQGLAIKVITELKNILEGFEYFKFNQSSETSRILVAHFSGEKGNYDYRFDELSDGQRMLIFLYTLLYATQSQDYTLCIDEPENFLALAEIQPWLMLLHDFCNDDELQALLISHHPELINYLAVSNGYWFDGPSNAPVRVKRITEDKEGGLSISELVARGWLYE